MKLDQTSKLMDEFLASTDIVDWQSQSVVDCAKGLLVDGSVLHTADRCFCYVRDDISHTFDTNSDCVTLRASEVFQTKTGICYAKSILLAALLRANRIPAGFGYQRLATDDSCTNHCLHGFNFVWLEEIGWHPLDARGNRPGIETVFDPPTVSLAFPAINQGEKTFDTIFSEPLPAVVNALNSSANRYDLESNLPDWNL